MPPSDAASTPPDPAAPAPSASNADAAPPFRYGPALAGRIELAWQDRWDRERTFAAPNPGEPGFDPARPKKFILDMFPYPSGAGLHVGHPLGYIATDIHARYLRMAGHNVLHAMGFDAFGLPAEQYALATGTHPRITTENNIASMRRQLRRLGLGHDPRRSVSTTDEAFYRWTQWIFLQIYHAWYDPAAGRARPIAELVAQFASGIRQTPSGRPWDRLTDAQQAAVLDEHRLAYLAEVPVNWCPMLGTVLANEEVTADGRSERGNHPVYKRPLKQWMMRITAYADRLLADLEGLHWPEPVKLMQRNWVGRSEGAHADFACGHRRIRVFTTRPDTMFGATYLVLAPEHPMVDELVADRYTAAPSGPRTRAIFPGAEPLLAAGAAPREVVAAYRAHAASRTDEARAHDQAKTGVFIGAFAVNPVSGARIPVFIADYVLAGYGTGAIMAVPAHDERDWAFAEAFGLPIVQVVRPPGAHAPTGCYTGEGVAVDSPPPATATSCQPKTGAPPAATFSINGLTTAQAKAAVGEHLRKVGLGEPTVTYKLRDWLFSRQRYWGEPFPIVFDKDGLAHPLPESMLPLTLPHLDDFKPESSADPDAPVRTPLARAADWARVTLDLGDGRGPRPFERETNTMPNWAGSCWYYLRYLDPDNHAAFVGKPAEQYWMGGVTSPTPPLGGVDLYVGGVEHAVLHLLYARFWHKVLFDLGHLSTPEPFQRLFSQGYIQAHAFTDDRGVHVDAFAVRAGDGSLAMDHPDKPGPFTFEGRPVHREYGKMGKSLKNALAPDAFFAEYGCDTLRVYEMSMGPLEASKPWNTRDIAGAQRFLQRVWRNLVDEQTGACRAVDAPTPPALLRLLHKTLIAVRRDFESLGFNTAVARLIEFNNELTRHVGEAGAPPRQCAEFLTLMLAPLAPHMAEELWSLLGHRTSLAHHPFPEADPALAADDVVEIPVQIGGKVRARVSVPAGSDAKAIEAAALADPAVQAQLEGRPIKKVIVAGGRLVNLVLG